MSTKEVRVHVTNIEWDMSDDGNETREYGTDIVSDVDHLPTEDILTLEMIDEYDENDLEDTVADMLSDYYGFLVAGFYMEVLD
jgi:hypothetical protein